MWDPRQSRFEEPVCFDLQLIGTRELVFLQAHTGVHAWRMLSSPSPNDMSSDEAKKKLLDLPINILVHNLLTMFAESPLDIVRFGCTCKAAHKLANDARLWSNFCRDFPCPDAGTWKALDSKHLYLALVLPYSHLLHHLWHSTTWPVGQLLKVDAEPPRLVANSLYYKSLNGGPYCHDVFAVELVQGQRHARVTCWRDRHGADGFESDAELRPAPAPPSVAARLSSSSDTIAALDLAPSGSHSPVAGPSSTTGPVNGPHGFVLSCKSRCDSVVTEFTNRKTKGKAYEEVRQKYLPSASTADSSSPSTDRSSSTSTTSALLPLPDVQQSPTIELIHFITLSDMRPIFSTPVYRQLDLTPWLSSRSDPRPSAWLCTGAPASRLDSPHPSAVAAHPSWVSSCDDTDLLVGSALSMTGVWRGTYGSHGVELLQLQLMYAPPGYDMFSSSSSGSSSDSTAAASGATAGDIFGSVAAAASVGGDASTVSEDVAAAIAADNTSDGVPGVVLGGVAGMTDASSAADRTRLYAELPGEAAAAGAPAESLVVVYDNPAAADAEQQQQQLPTHLDTGGVQSTVAAGSSSSRQQQLLLVATKLTGDMNVPVGCVSFAVHVGSQVPGGDEVLQLSAGADTDVMVNAPGTRQLKVKARCRGRAQIAFTGFQAPAVIAAELLVFTDSDVLGLIWKKPVDSFSLFSRVNQLP